MKIVPVLIIFFTATLKCATQTQTGTTMGIQERVAILKFQLSQQIKDNIANGKTYPIDNHDLSASYEYEDVHKPITPIMDFDERKKHGKYKLRALKKTTQKEWVGPKKEEPINKKNKTEIETSITEKNKADELSLNIDGKELLTHSPENKKKHGKNKKNILSKHRIVPESEKSKENDYRRFFIGNLEKHCVKETIHCTDLITPVLTGHKTNATVWKILSYNDNLVVRLVQLLGENTADLTQEEIYSILYQISNLQIRLFQWDVSAIKLLLNVITKEMVKRHSFKTIKEGLKRLLNQWHLDYSNVTNLMQQARLFRPPCIKINNYEGSTQSSKSVRITTAKKSKCPVGKIKKNGECEFY